MNGLISFYGRPFIFRSLLLPKLLILCLIFWQISYFIFRMKVYNVFFSIFVYWAEPEGTYILCLKHIKFVLKWTNIEQLKSSFLMNGFILLQMDEFVNEFNFWKMNEELNDSRKIMNGSGPESMVLVIFLCMIGLVCFCNVHTRTFLFFSYSHTM